MPNSPRHSVSVAAVVNNDHGEVLVIQRRDNGAWQIPGGVLELHEGIEDGLRREVLEETGLHVEPQRLTGVYKNTNLGVVALVFHASVVGGESGPSEEVTEVSWWTPEQVAAGMAEVFAVRIRDGLRADSPPVIREHDGTVLIQ